MQVGGIKFGEIFQSSAVALGLVFTSTLVWGLGAAMLSPGTIDPVGDVLTKFGVNVSVHVASNSDLKAYRYGGVVVRDGFTSAGDGGKATYTHSRSPCSLNVGAGDNGAQVRDAAAPAAGLPTSLCRSRRLYGE